jgi:hypothetical protein
LIFATKSLNTFHPNVVDHAIAGIVERPNSPAFTESPKNETPTGERHPQTFKPKTKGDWNDSLGELTPQLTDQPTNATPVTREATTPKNASEQVRILPPSLRSIVSAVLPFGNSTDVSMADVGIVVCQKQNLPLGEVADEIENLGERIVIQMLNDGG